MAMFIWVQFRLRLPIAVSVDAKRDVELAAEVGDEVRRVEVILDAREAVALDFDAIEATNELAIRVRVPEKEERLASVPALLSAVASRRLPYIIPWNTPFRAAAGPYSVWTPTTSMLAVSRSSAVRRSMSRALNASQNASSTAGAGAGGSSGSGCTSLPRPRCRAALTAPTVVESDSAISSSVSSKT